MSVTGYTGNGKDECRRQGKRGYTDTHEIWKPSM